jgi:hypothetical protein
MAEGAPRGAGRVRAVRWVAPWLMAPAAYGLAWWGNVALEFEVPLGGGNGAFLALAAAGLLAYASVVATVVLAVAWLVSRRGGARRTVLLVWALACVPCFGAGLGGAERGGANRMERYARVAARGDRIVAALEAYRADHGAYPESLGTLVPGYLAELPRPGLAHSREFRYQRVDEMGGVPHGEYATGGYELDTPCGGFIDFDHLFYWPSRTYPAFAHGGDIQRIGAWAYADE